MGLFIYRGVDKKFGVRRHFFCKQKHIIEDGAESGNARGDKCWKYKRAANAGNTRVWRVTAWRDSSWQDIAMEMGASRPMRPSRRRWMK